MTDEAKQEDPKEHHEHGEGSKDGDVGAGYNEEEVITEDGKRKAKPVEGNDPSSISPARIGKRERKVASSFAPADFTPQNVRVAIIQGRGKKLGDIPSVAKSIDAATKVSYELTIAHKLLFPVRGKITSADKKSNLLEFSGYLPILDEKMGEKEREQAEEDVEAKFSQRAYKFKVSEIRMMCDFFNVDRSGITNKEDLIDALLNFLGTCDESLLKGAAKKATQTKQVKKKKKVKVSVEDSENAGEEAQDDDEFNVVPGVEPSDKALRRWVKAYVACFNMDKATLRHTIETVSDKFGVDLKHKKAKIKEFLTEEM